MKRILLISLLLTICAAAADAQQEQRPFKFYDKTEFGFGFGIGSFKADIYDGIQKNLKNNEIILSLQTINGLMLYNRVGVGLGIGAEMWQHGYFFPLFGQLSYHFKPAPNSVFASLSAGYSFGNWEEMANQHEAGSGGFMFSAGVGYAREVAKRLRFHFEAFYKYQVIASSYNVFYSDSTKTDAQIEYNVPLHFIGFRVGVMFR